MFIRVLISHTERIFPAERSGKNSFKRKGNKYVCIIIHALIVYLINFHGNGGYEL